MASFLIVNNARSAGVQFRLEDDRLLLKGADADMAAAIRTNKAGIMAALRAPGAPSYPVEWREGVERMRRMDCPVAFDPARWAAMQADADAFLARWAAQAAAPGWTTSDLFGVRRIAPVVRYNCAGLIVILNGSAVDALTSETALIVEPHGTRHSFRRGSGLRFETTEIWKLF